MKATFKSMMVIGMMILGTVTSFASNNIDKHHNPGNKAKAECHINHIHDKHCGGHVIADHPQGTSGNGQEDAQAHEERQASL